MKIGRYSEGHHAVPLGGIIDGCVAVPAKAVTENGLAASSGTVKAIWICCEIALHECAQGLMELRKLNRILGRGVLNHPVRGPLVMEDGVTLAANDVEMHRSVKRMAPIVACREDVLMTRLAEGGLMLHEHARRRHGIRLNVHGGAATARQDQAQQPCRKPASPSRISCHGANLVKIGRNWLLPEGNAAGVALLTNSSSGRRPLGG